jgi:hypothetical protein
VGKGKKREENSWEEGRSTNRRHMKGLRTNREEEERKRLSSSEEENCE